MGTRSSLGLSAADGSPRRRSDRGWLAPCTRDKTVIILDRRTGNAVASLEGHDDHVRYAAYLTDGKTLVSVSADRTVIVWDVASRKPRGRFGYTENAGIFLPTDNAASPNGRWLAQGNLAGDNAVIWDLSDYLPKPE